MLGFSRFPECIIGLLEGRGRKISCSLTFGHLILRLAGIVTVTGCPLGGANRSEVIGRGLRTNCDSLGTDLGLGHKYSNPPKHK